MKKIIKSVIVSDLYPNEFNVKLGKYIDDFQGNGYEIDIQYSFNNGYYTALVLIYAEDNFYHKLGV